ncbi:NAD-P-binding protein [Mycena latifolia]|nr:NAD-P-binding protein [Mycena latifolia]
MSLPTFSSTTTAEEVANVFAGEIRGKNVLITGASPNGLGFETARVIAKHANLLIIAGHNLERLKLTEAAIQEEVPSINIHCLPLDLSSLAAVRKAAAHVDSHAAPIHVLIHNAAATVGSFKLTVDDLESQMQTDHIGPFLLTKLLAPKLLAAGTPNYVPRVVFLSSAAHKECAEINFNTMRHPDPAQYVGHEAYTQAKSANIMTAIELSKRSKGKINAYSLHPGVILTNINQNPAAISEMQAIGVLDADGKPSTEKYEWKTIPQGAATTIAAAFDTRLHDKPGAYLSDCIEANQDRAPHTTDPDSAAKLWTVTEEIIGEKFTF